MGKISCIAKGSKRNQSPFLGAIDIFVLYEITNIDKSPSNLDILTSALPLENYSNLRRNITSYFAANYIAQFIDELTIEGQENPGLFEEIEGVLESLDKGGDVFNLVTRFELKALRILGYLPRFTECGYCKTQITGENSYFSTRDGGAICLKCRTRGPVPMLVETQVLKRLQDGEFAATSPLEKQKTRDLLDYHISFITGKKLLTISRYLY